MSDDIERKRRFTMERPDFEGCDLPDESKVKPRGGKAVAKADDQGDEPITKTMNPLGRDPWGWWP